MLAEERATLFPPETGETAREYGAALCLSGGGVRSAAICLGVLQALADEAVLTRFHWVSSVSGGGYAGSWMQAWIRNAGADAASVQAAMGGTAEAPEVNRLREWSNYLTPKAGLFSADTWTGLALWVRNVLINWMVFGPILFGTTAVPVWYLSALSLTRPDSVLGNLMGGAALLLFATIIGARYLPSHIDMPDHPRIWRPGEIATPTEPPRLYAKGIGLLIVFPVAFWSLTVPLWWSVMTGRWMPLLVPVLDFLTLIAGYLIVTAFFAGTPAQRKIYTTNFWNWLFASLASAAGLWLGGRLLDPGNKAWLSVLGPPWVMGTSMLQTIVYVALRSTPARGDLDREWLARTSAVKAMVGAGWLGFACVTVLLPPLVFGAKLPGLFHAIDLKITALGAAASGGLAAYLAKRAQAVGVQIWSQVRSSLNLSVEFVISLATLLFGVLLFMMMARMSNQAVDFVTDVLARQIGLRDCCDHDELRPIVAVMLVIASYNLGLLADWRINLNRFSLHATYRNRLSRAFLGSTLRAEVRSPDPWTDFDPCDNPRMADLMPRNRDGRVVLLPVINATLNMAGGDRWPERKGRPFTITPLHCGFGDPPPGGRTFQSAQIDAEGRQWPRDRGTFVATRFYGGGERETGLSDARNGLTLATAMTISGAAVSPSMGYHSQPATAFLMTLFDVRLGAWLANPIRASRSQLASARPPPISLLLEMLGRTDDRSRAIYLSDGGHFDNLGLYEALRRRPALIVAVDATNDPKYQYADLAASIRKARTDLDTTITLAPGWVLGQPLPDGFITGEIRYAEDTKALKPAILVYIKSGRFDTWPPDLQEYAGRAPDFPHTPTANQFFKETQFESYRALGRLLGANAAETIGAALGRAR